MQLEEFDIARRMIAMYPKDLQFVTTADGIEQAFKAGKIASLLGMEGGHAIENSLGALRSYYALGARYMTLTHNVTLDWADAALDSAAHGGLTPFGVEVVHEMNRLGMMVDLSHVSPGVMSNVLDVTAVTGDLLALLGAGPHQPPAECSRFHPAAAAEERRGRDGHLRALVREPAVQRVGSVDGLGG